jgi:hypothetical protein
VIDLTLAQVAVLATVIATLGGVIGGSVKFLFSTRTTTEAALAAREARVVAHEAEYTRTLEKRFSTIETGLAECERREVEINAKFKRVLLVQDRMRRANLALTGGLMRVAPDDPALEEARVILDQAFPVDPDLPDDWDDLLQAIDAAPVRETRRKR